jgi:hypothetical protein
MTKSCVRAKGAEGGATVTIGAIALGGWTFIDAHPAARNASPETW